MHRDYIRPAWPSARPGERPAPPPCPAPQRRGSLSRCAAACAPPHGRPPPCVPPKAVFLLVLAFVENHQSCCQCCLVGRRPPDVMENGGADAGTHLLDPDGLSRQGGRTNENSTAGVPIEDFVLDTRRVPAQIRSACPLGKSPKAAPTRLGKRRQPPGRRFLAQRRSPPASSPHEPLTD